MGAQIYSTCKFSSMLKEFLATYSFKFVKIVIVSQNKKKWQVYINIIMYYINTSYLFQCMACMMHDKIASAWLAIRA